MKIPNDINFIDYLNFVGKQQSQDLHGIDYWREGLLSRLSGNEETHGDYLPWSKTHSKIRLRPGEISLWAGINGHRKSMISGQVALWLSRDQPVCIASLEMKPESTIERMCTQAAGCRPSPGFAQEFLEWGNERIWIYDKLDSTPTESILGVCYYAAKVLGCKHVFIDSLMKCGVNSDDYTKQKEFVDRLALCAKQNNIHIHLVCHMRKGQDEHHRPGKFDVKGASEITDLVDNVFVCWKDKQREEAASKKENNLPLSDKDLKALERCDQILSVEKQRHGEWEGGFKLWFHKHSLQFIGDDRNHAMPFQLTEV